ncbi:MAG TPA: aspartate 1-decarboxylase [Solirubrobacterales bacterium]|nr:aspartate 1-decarboxylase [Solirubrobacterales bacterium]
MQRQMLKSKIHRATVTGCDIDYVGSVTVDSALLEASDILVNELVHVWDITNGSRFITYAIEGERDSGDIQINGAAARLVNEGDLVIIASYADYDEKDLETYAPVVVHVDADNRAALVDSHPEILLAHGPSGEDEIPGALGVGDSFGDTAHLDGSLG